MRKKADHLFLIGFMGSGKSSVAKRLAVRLGRDRIEMDEKIEQDQEMTISEIFREYGEEYFRGLESRLLKDLASAPPAVVSCGGGVAMREENVKLMKESGTVLYLSASPRTIYKRVRYATHRPLLEGNMNVAYISALMEKRRPYYEKAADIVIETDHKSLARIVDEILALPGIQSI